MTKEKALDIAIDRIHSHGYIMTNDNELLSALKELENDGLLLRGDRNPVGDFNPSYTFIER